MLPSAIVESRSLALAYAVLVYVSMVAMATVLVRRGPARRLTASSDNRIGALDGLRGMLAVGVFVHHSVTSYVWVTTGVWSWGPNAVLNQLGQTTVALFFMVTGFLFTLKTMTPIKWGVFIRGRLARLAPLYVVVVFAVFTIVLIVSGGLRESVGNILVELALWLAFVCFGRPDVNAYVDTWTIVAGVNWSLKYEVIFYVFAVPLLYWVNRVTSAWTAFLMSSAAFIGMMLLHRATGRVHGNVLFGLHFLGGIMVAYAYSIVPLRARLESSLVRMLGAAAALSLVWMIDAASPKAIVAAVLVFAAVVGNGSMFGLFKTRAALWLGDISYGIYLLHGMILWLAFKAVGPPKSLESFVVFALVVSGISTLAATLSYLSLELPVMRQVRNWRTSKQSL